MSHIGEVIAEWMGDMSEGELSRRSKVTQPTIHRILSGESKEPRRGNLEKICRTLGKTVEELYSQSRTKNPGAKHAVMQDTPEYTAEIDVEFIVESVKTMTRAERRELQRRLIDLDD